MINWKMDVWSIVEVTDKEEVLLASHKHKMSKQVVFARLGGVSQGRDVG